MMNFPGVSESKVDALAIIDHFVVALARGSMYPREAVTLAANHMANPGFDNEPANREVIAAIVKWLREQAED